MNMEHCGRGNSAKGKCLLSSWLQKPLTTRCFNRFKLTFFTLGTFPVFAYRAHLVNPVLLIGEESDFVSASLRGIIPLP